MMATAPATGREDIGMYNRAMRAKFRVTVHLFFFRENQILLLRRSNTGYGDGQYSVPAGHLDGDETVWAAAIREAREEIGVEIVARDIAFSSVMHRREGDEAIDFFLQASAWKGEPTNTEPQKCDDLRWVSLQALPENTIPYVRRAIENHLQHVNFDQFGW